MARVIDGNSNVHDFCNRHFPSKSAARRLYGAGDGPDGRGNCYVYDAEHPPYQGEDYRCDTRGCRKVLTDRDD